MTQTLHLSKLLITNSGEPIINGALLINNSKIVSAGKVEDFGNLTNYKVIDHEDSLICPGFINLHTHLLYSKLGQVNGSDGLFPWLEKLITETKDWQEADYISSINFGIDQALSTGTTFVIENTPSILSAQELSKSPLKALIGIEVFGSDEERADEVFKNTLNNFNKHSTSHIHHSSFDLTFSPHAPYDVSKSLWTRLLQWSQENNKPLLTHLEESPDEKNWWQNKSGSAINFWKKINKLESKLKSWKKYNSGIDFLNKNNLLNKNIIGTHLCQAGKEDLKLLKEKNIKLVHCPRSNYYLNNGTANLKLWNELGIVWGIGTDSIASNGNLNLLEEVRFAIKEQSIVYNYNLSAREVFEAITSTAAKIISKEHELGYLKEGYCTDFLVYDIKDKPASTYKDLYSLMIFNIDNNKDLKEVWISGQKAWLRTPVLNRI
ncbi:MAG: hypothetical protein A3I68_04340 [Candidatus Melainabacteria bacterium RIFCSPLOWO2_02_FULL_35_15]|nr:MAG: hypothetical protein A3F80_06220 [Candidatus Melainabacteria bacterium RIFCSPLOWO2_12_FULL_35_11]OGI14485.1 MAG: hypothetical protein A3I68_04340 [Candidatus Melainabacteria bacterium RIFCSPLOWO2_02_FULL_35_15]